MASHQPLFEQRLGLGGAHEYLRNRLARQSGSWQKFAWRDLYDLRKMQVADWAEGLPMVLGHAVLPHPTRGKGRDDGDRGSECAGLDGDLNLQGTQLGECDGHGCGC